ncbi:transport protein TonB [Mariprofundus micogutta]|uniref:Transport protein TonB n=1 Tax=Mariprofundus micogutta TaxID=1921010 RepID=A0A1L8CL24_9PROT|nr:energy transducer TonB [Mariprofundus micogutta]GAV19616.1 transport protein TonB [Mariprofundus micogutta]
MASAAIHGLLFVVWLDLSGSSSAVSQKQTVLEVVSIEAIPEEKPATLPSKPAISENNSAKAPKQVTQRKPAAVVVQPARSSMHQAASQALEAEKPVSAISETESQIAAAVVSQSASNIAQHEQINTLVRNHLESFKFYPASARRRGIEGHVDVAFVLSHNGSADQIKLLQGSGYAMLDRAAMQTVSRAQPFPVDDGSYRFRLRFKRL